MWQIRGEIGRNEKKNHVEDWRNRGDMKENGNKCEQNGSKKDIFAEKIKDRVS